MQAAVIVNTDTYLGRFENQGFIKDLQEALKQMSANDYDLSCYIQLSDGLHYAKWLPFSDREHLSAPEWLFDIMEEGFCKNVPVSFFVDEIKEQWFSFTYMANKKMQFAVSEDLNKTCRQILCNHLEITTDNRVILHKMA